MNLIDNPIVPVALLLLGVVLSFILINKDLIFKKKK